MAAIRDLIESLNKDFYKKSQFSDLENSFSNVYSAMIDLLCSFLLKCVNEDINDIIEVDSLIKEYKIVLHDCINMIKNYDSIFADKKEYNDTDFIWSIDTDSKYAYDMYDTAIKNVNSKNALKINNMIFSYQMLLRFLNSMLLSHSNYKGKLANVERPLILNIDVVDVEKFLVEYLKEI